jgi:L-aspartate oxidase
MDRFDVLVIGSGIAGLSVALAARPARVAVVTRGLLGRDGASTWAQGGIAAALAEGDSPAAHAADTIAAGAGHNDRRAVERLVHGARSAIAWLEQLGVAFDRDASGLLLGREAAHGAARIVHAGGDATGAAVMQALARAVHAAPHVTVFEQADALELAVAHGRVVGAWIAMQATGRSAARGAIARDTRPIAPQATLLRASHTVLATGGIGQLYRHTTNPEFATGDGLALALAAGARLRDLEFVQFHPTALATGADVGTLPLVTEALRGAGAVLRDAGGRRFMPRYDARAELAPRDVVARAVFRETLRGAVYLDARDALGATLPSRFPTVFAACRRHGIDPREAPIPVTPAVHYHMGGVAVDALGASSAAGLYAVGECACNGVHGANRLASNSLLEGLVFGRALGMRLGAGAPYAAPLAPSESHATAPAAAVPPVPPALRDLLWRAVGPWRRGDALREAQARFESEAARAADARSRGRWQVAAALAAAASRRTLSLGAHQRDDAPGAAPRSAVASRA